MKTFKLLALLSVVSGVILLKIQNAALVYGDVSLENIEALANSENDGGLTDCKYEGSVKCADGGYAKYVFYRFDKISQY